MNSGELYKLYELFRRCRIVFNQARDGFSRLRADRKPILHALVFQIDFRRIGHRIISSDVFDIFSVTLRAFFLNDDAIKRTFLRAHSH